MSAGDMILILYYCINYRYMDPMAPISIFREARYGHGELEVVNATHAQWTWHRNDNDKAVAADSVWITSLSSNPNCKMR